MKILAAACLALASLAACAQAPATPAAPPLPAEVKQLIVRDLKPGEGKVAEKEKAVLVFYTGWLYDPKRPEGKGAQFDSNEGKPVPFGFIIGRGRVIKGWDDGVAGMKEGGRRLLVIPPELAYGVRQMGDKIPPNSTLLFEVQLVSVVN